MTAKSPEQSLGALPIKVRTLYPTTDSALGVASGLGSDESFGSGFCSRALTAFSFGSGFLATGFFVAFFAGLGSGFTLALFFNRTWFQCRLLPFSQPEEPPPKP